MEAGHSSEGLPSNSSYSCYHNSGLQIHCEVCDLRSFGVVNAKGSQKKDCSKMSNMINHMSTKGNLTIVDSFSLPRLPPEDSLSAHYKSPQAPTAFTLKKKKLEHFINNLFKVANEKVTHDETKVKFENVSATNTNHCALENDRMENNRNFSSLGVNLKENIFAETEVIPKIEPEISIKSEEDIKPAERVFGWCSIEELSSPVIGNNQNPLEPFGQPIKEEEFEVKQEPPPTPAYEMNHDYKLNLFDPSEVKEEAIEEHEMKIEPEISIDEEMFIGEDYSSHSQQNIKVENKNNKPKENSPNIEKSLMETWKKPIDTNIMKSLLYAKKSKPKPADKDYSWTTKPSRKKGETFQCDFCKKVFMQKGGK